MSTQFISTGVDVKDGGVMIARGTFNSHLITSNVNPGSPNNYIPILNGAAASDNTGWKLVTAGTIGSATGYREIGANLYPANRMTGPYNHIKSTDYQEGHENTYNENELSPGTIGFAVKYIFDWSKVLDTSVFSLDANNTVFSQPIDFGADSGLTNQNFNGYVILTPGQPTRYSL